MAIFYSETPSTYVNNKGETVPTTKRMLRVNEPATLYGFTAEDIKPASKGDGAYVLLNRHLVFLNKEYTLDPTDLGTENIVLKDGTVKTVKVQVVSVIRDNNEIPLFDGNRHNPEAGIQTERKAITANDFKAKIAAARAAQT